MSQAPFHGHCNSHNTYHVGADKYTVVPGKNLLMKAAPTRKDPVPDKDCTVATRPSTMAGCPLPSMSSAARSPPSRAKREHVSEGSEANAQRLQDDHDEQTLCLAAEGLGRAHTSYDRLRTLAARATRIVENMLADAVETEGAEASINAGDARGRRLLGICGVWGRLAVCAHWRAGGTGGLRVYVDDSPWEGRPSLPVSDRGRAQEIGERAGAVAAPRTVRCPVSRRRRPPRGKQAANAPPAAGRARSTGSKTSQRITDAPGRRVFVGFAVQTLHPPPPPSYHRRTPNLAPIYPSTGADRSVGRGHGRRAGGPRPWWMHCSVQPPHWSAQLAL
eukprot:scaffold1219_cov400-Prasinococcus_capsulatus_cf.AAC.1